MLCFHLPLSNAFFSSQLLFPLSTASSPLTLYSHYSRSGSRERERYDRPRERERGYGGGMFQRQQMGDVNFVFGKVSRCEKQNGREKKNEQKERSEM